ncbi:hypothetical protein BDF22DRAFT_775558 [Syncephalis plumigaleata]|nr:hypothetical protein BDF22DRAFT_775558 [Syncephalis plumigaleata]
MQLIRKVSLPDLPQSPPPLRMASSINEPATLTVDDPSLDANDTHTSKTHQSSEKDGTLPYSATHAYEHYTNDTTDERIISVPTIYITSPSSSTSSLSLLATTDTPCWLKFTDAEQLNILLVAMETPTLFNNCMKMLQHNSGTRTYQVLTQLMNTCEDPNLSYRALLVRFGEYGTVTFREPFDRLVNLVISGMRYSKQSHLLAGHLCRLTSRLCSRDDHRFPRLNEFSDVIRHLPILSNTSTRATGQPIDHPLLSDFTLMNVGQSELELPKLIAAEGVLKTIFATASLPADYLSDSTQMNQSHSSLIDSKKRPLLLEHIHVICYELLVDDRCSRVIADVIHQLQHTSSS